MKITTISINNQLFSYEDEIDDITYDTIGPISVDDAQALLCLTKRLFDQVGIRFMLAYGTLLGAVREKGLIEGDEDVDIFVESEEILRNNLPFFTQYGLKICRIFEHKLYSFRINERSYIDVYIKEPVPYSQFQTIFVNICGHHVPKKYVADVEPINFLGIDCLAPYKPERILAYWYGKDWHTPKKGFRGCAGNAFYTWFLDHPRYKNKSLWRLFVLFYLNEKLVSPIRVKLALKTRIRQLFNIF